LVRLVRQHGLARVESATLMLHRLLAAILRAQTHQQPDLPTLAVRLLRGAVPADDPWYNPPVWPAWRPLLPHVLVATDSHRALAGVGQDAAWLLDRAAEYLQARGEPTPARPLFERARDLYRSMLGDDHPDTLESASRMSYNLWVLGQYEQARQLAEETLTCCRRLLGEDHPDTLRSAYVFAVALWALGQYERARELGEDTLTRCRRVLGEDHPDTLRAADDFTAHLANLGEHDQAPRLGRASV
jgi:tetratricopeptide (TPR) repeat protein